MVQILSTPLIVSFFEPSNRETNRENKGKETIGGGLKQLEEIEDFLHSKDFFPL